MFGPIRGDCGDESWTGWCGGASTVRQFVRAGLVEEMHLAVAPVLLGRGERLFGDLSELEDAFTIDLVTSSPAAAHFMLQRR